MRLPNYLDYNATTPVAPEVFEGMRPFLHELFGNPSSSHSYGQHAREAIDQARGCGDVDARKSCRNRLHRPCNRSQQPRIARRGGFVTAQALSRHLGG